MNVKITVFRGATSCILGDTRLGFGQTYCLLMKMEATRLYHFTQLHGVRPHKTVTFCIVQLYVSVMT
jgi:hypothetical protein